MGSTRFARTASGLLVPRPRFFQGNCPCSGSSSCTIFSDDFTRADSTNIGSDWTETSGDWSIASNKLSISSTSSATATANVTHSSSALQLSVTVTCSTSGGKVRLYIGSNYGELVFSGGSGSININGASSGSGYIAATLNTGTAYSVLLCLTSSGGLVCTANSVSAVLTVSPASPGVSFAVGTGSVSTSTTFDSFVATKVEAGCASCVLPCGNCDPGTIPTRIQLDIAGFPDFNCNCSNFNGTWVVDVYGLTPGVSPECRWDNSDNTISFNRWDYSGLVCVSDNAYFQVRIGVNSISVVLIWFSGPMAIWRLTLTTPIDCVNDIASLSIPNNLSGASSGPCGFYSYSAPTCALTSLA